MRTTLIIFITPIYAYFDTLFSISSFPDVKLNIVTFLKGEREVDKPIHKFFKPIEKKQIIFAIKLLADKLKKYL